jgi:hypothetical protein
MQKRAVVSTGQEGEQSMGETPAASRAILQMLRAGALLALVVVALIIGIEIWKTLIASGGRHFVAGDYLFFAVLAGLFIGLAWLCQAISRELRKP